MSQFERNIGGEQWTIYDELKTRVPVLIETIGEKSQFSDVEQYKIDLS